MTLCYDRQELGKGINTDEAAAMGSVYQAAHLSKGFRVKKFAIKDANLFPIQVCRSFLWRYVSRWVERLGFSSQLHVNVICVHHQTKSISNCQKTSLGADKVYVNRHTSCTLCRYDLSHLDFCCKFATINKK